MIILKNTSGLFFQNVALPSDSVQYLIVLKKSKSSDSIKK